MTPARASVRIAREMVHVPEPTSLLRASDLTATELHDLLDLAALMKSAPADWCDALRAETLICCYEQPSVRTRAAFAAAAHRLGMLPLQLGPEELRRGGRETVEDTARMLSGLGAALVLRARDHATLERLAAAATVPVVNARSATHHPCQALALLLTLRERFGTLTGLRVAYVGDGGALAHSLLEAGALVGLHVVVATPQDRAPDAEVVETATAAAHASGGRVELTDDPYDAVRGARAVCTDVWAPADAGEDANPDADGREPRRSVADLVTFRVDADLMREASPDAIFLHGLPAQRGQEVTAEVIDGPDSWVWAQAENRLPVAQALVYALCAGDWSGTLGFVPSDPPVPIRHLTSVDGGRS